jgi:hypothetical protein
VLLLRTIGGGCEKPTMHSIFAWVALFAASKLVFRRVKTLQKSGERLMGQEQSYQGHRSHT